MKALNTYKYEFSNGNFEIENIGWKWVLRVNLNDGFFAVPNDEIHFMTRKSAKNYAIQKLSQYNLI